MKKNKKIVVIDPDHVTLARLACATYQVGTLGNTTTIYANGVMQAVLFLEYAYACPDVTYVDGFENTVDAAMVRHLIDNEQLHLRYNAASINELGWEVASTSYNPLYLHDIALATSGAQTPVWNATTKVVNGVVRIFVAAPSGTTGTVTLDAQYGAFVSNTIAIKIEPLTIDKQKLALSSIHRAVQSRKINDYYELFALKYVQGTVGDRVKLLGLAHDGKYGILLSSLQSPSEQYCNILITFAQRNDSKIAGFYDPTLFPAAKQFSAGWSLGHKLYATRYNGVAPSYCEQYYCNGAGWDELRQIGATDFDAAFAAGIPFIMALQKNGYQLSHEASDDKPVDMGDGDGQDKWHAVYDNCGNRILFRLNYKNNSWTEASSEHIAILEGKTDGGYVGILIPSWTRADFQPA